MEQFGTTKTCGSCRLWAWANKEKTLKKCAGDNGCAITGPAFFCANWEKSK